MSYFKNFPLIAYTFDTGMTVSAFAMTDILRRVKINEANISTTLAYDEYDIIDGETPEIVSDRIYGSPDYHWVVLIANEILDPRYDWPLGVTALNSYIEEKYGVGNQGGIHHYENEFGDTVHSSYAGTKIAITNLDYEEAVNEGKRRIRLIKPQFVAQFIENFIGLLKNGN